MFNMLEIYRSRFTKRMRNRTQKRSNTAYSRADSICMANMNSNVYGIGSILAMGPMPLERPISSSNSSLTTTNSLTNRNAVPSPPKENSSTEKKRIIPIQKILSLETDKFEYIINNLNLCDEDRLLNILTEYFLSKEDVNSFTCSSQTTATSSEESRSSISSHYSLTTTSDEFQARRQNSGKKTLNRCYYASIQAHMALAFKSMDTNYDNKLSMDEFVIGIRATLNESCIRKLCAKSYQTLALSILNNTAVLKRLFRKFDLNDDCFIDFSNLKFLHIGTLVDFSSFDAIDSKMSHILRHISDAEFLLR